VREVLAEIGAAQVPELLVINKADIADPVDLGRLQMREPHSVVVSAATGAGIATLLEAIENDLPNPPEPVDVLLGFDRGDLVARVHEEGRDVEVEYTDRGARVTAIVGAHLAAELGAASLAAPTDGAAEVGTGLGAPAAGPIDPGDPPAAPR
jgi:GTP-binding protein HflX